MTKRGDARRFAGDRLAHGACRPLIENESSAHQGGSTAFRKHNDVKNTEISQSKKPPSTGNEAHRETPLTGSVSIAGYLRQVMTKRCMKIHAKSNSAIESAFPLHIVLDGSVSPLKK